MEPIDTQDSSPGKIFGPEEEIPQEYQKFGHTSVIPPTEIPIGTLFNSREDLYKSKLHQNPRCSFDGTFAKGINAVLLVYVA